MDTSISLSRAIPGRLDRLPLSRELLRIMLLAGIAWLIESYDIGIMGNVLPSLQAQYHLSTFEVGALTIASTLGIVAAIVPSGWLADRFGRKKVLIYGTIWYALFSLLGGLAPNIEMLLALRFVAGVGMGAVFPIPYAIATEFMPRNARGAMVAILDSFLSFGYFLAPLIAFALIPRLADGLGWRLLFFIGGLPLLYVPVLIKWLPESPRWLQTKGRDGEAEHIVRGLETRIERRTGAPLPPPSEESPVSSVQQKASFKTIFRGAYLARTIMMWIAFPCILFIFYAIQTYTPTVLVKQGYAIGDAFLLTTIIVLASIPGKYAAAYMVERFGRKVTLLCFTLLAAAGALLFGFAHSAGLALFCGCLMSFFGIGVDPVIKVYGAEQYPTSVRETGVSCFEGVGRFFGGALAPFIMAFILGGGGIAGSYVFVAVVALVGLLAVMLLGKETKGQAIESVSSAESEVARAS